MFDQYMGVIKALGFNFTPEEWGRCAGASMAINQFTSLFSLLGCRFGGDCRVSFDLPDLRGRSPMGFGTGPGLTPRFLGLEYGMEHHVFTYNTMPAHTHAHSYNGTSGNEMAVHASKEPGKKQLPSTGDYIAPPASGLGAITDNLFIAPADVTPAVEKTVGGVHGGTGGFENVLFTIHSTPQPTDYVYTQQPSQSANYCICMEGIYPSRS